MRLKKDNMHSLFMRASPRRNKEGVPPDCLLQSSIRLAAVQHEATMPDLNLLTDISGIRVGGSDDQDVITGVTAILFDGDVVASGTTRGGAPGTRDTCLLDPEMTIEGVHAVLLSGGSVFGLDAAGGALAYLREQGCGLAIGSVCVPIVSQAITFDLLNGGNKQWRDDPLYWRLGWQAAASARDGTFELGSVGGGLGATTANLKGGLGSASAVTSRGIRVAAIVVVNAVGSVTIGDGPWFWAAHCERDAEFGGLGQPAFISEQDRTLRIKGGAPPSTTIALVATDAVLNKPQARRMAIMADDGLARAVRPAHAPMDGDTVFAAATLDKPLMDPIADLTEIGNLAADCLSRAIARGVYHATTKVAGYTGPPAYCDVHCS